ncbi:DUF484 family protein [Neisseriaceae bacterium CLB008]|nr:DUF484 family protein [Neisseriaceae bacterium]
MNEASLLDFLKNHPEFLLTHAKILGIQPNNDKITAFAEVKLQANEIRTQRMEQHLNDVIDNARHNQALIETLFNLDHALIGATSLADITTALTKAMTEGFDLPYYVLKLVQPAHSIQPTLPAALLLNEGGKAYEKLNQLKRSVCDQYLADDVLAWLPPSATTLQSFLKVPLLTPEQGFMGVLIVASPNPQHFGPEQDTHYMDHLAQNLGAALNRLFTVRTA